MIELNGAFSSSSCESWVLMSAGLSGLWSVYLQCLIVLLCKANLTTSLSRAGDFSKGVPYHHISSYYV